MPRHYIVLLLVVLAAVIAHFIGILTVLEWAALVCACIYIANATPGAP